MKQTEPSDVSVYILYATPAAVLTVGSNTYLVSE